MFRKSIYFLVVGLVAVGLFNSSPVASAADSKDTVLLVLPSHYTIVQLGFDMAKLRKDVLIVCYNEKGAKTGQSLYIWDPNATPAKWVPTTFENYSSGEAFGVKPGKVLILGTEKDVPAVLAGTSKWCSDVTRANTLEIMELINSLNATFKFTSSEWKWIAKEYDLKLEDMNAERRRYGKYGKPGERAKVEVPGVEVKETKKPVPAVVTAPVVIQSEAPVAVPSKSAPEDK